MQKKQIITTERRLLAPQPAIKKVWGNGILSRPYFYTDKLAASALQLHAQNCSRSTSSDLEAARPPSSITEPVRKAMAKGLLVAQDTSCLHTVSPCSAQGGSHRPALLVPFVLAPKRDLGSNPFRKSMNILCWCCRAQPPQSRGQESTERKSCPD